MNHSETDPGETHFMCVKHWNEHIKEGKDFDPFCCKCRKDKTCKP